MDALGINLGFLIAQIVNFLVLALILGFLAWRPMTRMLDERAAKIAKGLEDADIAAKARANAEVEAEKILENARRQASGFADEARGRGDEAATGIVAEAEEEATAIKAHAREEAEQQRDQLLAGMRDQVASLAMAAAHNLIGKVVDEERQQKLVADFFAKAPDDARNLGGSVEVVSALPLTDAEKKDIEETTKASEISFQVDPGLLGGVIIRSGDRVIDGSVRAGLGEMASRLN